MVIGFYMLIFHTKFDPIGHRYFLVVLEFGNIYIKVFGVIFISSLNV